MNLLRTAPYSLKGLNVKDEETWGKPEETLILKYNNEKLSKLLVKLIHLCNFSNGAVIYRLTNEKKNCLEKEFDKHLIFEVAMTNWFHWKLHKTSWLLLWCF